MFLESSKDKILQEDLEWIANKEKNLENCTILVTGATGLIGSQIVKALLCKNRLKNSNINVIALVRSKEKVEKVFEDVLERENLKFIYGDILKTLDIEEKVDYIIHTASMTSSRDFVNRPVETIESVVYGTNNVLKLAKNKKVKQVIYLSTMEVYGVGDWDHEKVTEKQLGYIDVLEPRSSYPEGKRLAENLCASYWSEYGVPVKIARLAQTFGSGISEEESRIFAQIGRSIINKKDIILHTKGDSINNCCYTRDVVYALLLLINRGKNGEAYTITNEEACMSILDMAKLTAEKISENQVKVVIDIPKDISSYGYAPKKTIKLSSKKIQDLGWKAEIELEEAYRRMIESMKTKV